MALLASSPVACGDSGDRAPDSNGGRAGTAASSGNGGGEVPAGSSGAGAAGDVGIRAGAGGGAPPGGSAGVGGEDEPCDESSCDDGYDCTLDRLEADCTCTHEPVPDGAACDDANACTDGDVCSSGSCSGSARTSLPEIIGSVRSFGAAPGLQTLVALPRAGRAVFASTKRLTLVALGGGGGASVLDDVAMSAPVVSDSVGSMVWTSRPRTFLIPVLESHLAVVSQNWGIELFNLEGDRIAASERYGFDQSEAQIRAATGGGARLFTCISSELRAWAIDPSTRLVTRGSSLRLPTGHVCQGLALAPDGQSLYAATSRGLDRIDTSNADGSLVLDGGAHSDEFISDVQANADRVAIFRVREATSGFGDVLVLSAETLADVAAFPGDLAQGGIVPVGFAFSDRGRFLLQRSRSSGCSRRHEALHFELGSPETEIARLELLEACNSPFLSPSFRTIAAGEHAVLEPTHQLLDLDPQSGALSPLESLHQGSFERVRALGPGLLSVFGPSSLHHVDITDPTAPAVVAGGPVFPMNLEWLRLDLSHPGAPAFVTVRDPALGAVAGPKTTILRSVSDELPAVAGSISNDDPRGVWLASGAFLYQLSTRETSLRLRRFSARNVTRARDQTLVPDLDQQLVTELPAGLELRRSAAFAVDAPAGDVVVVETRAASEASGSDNAVLTWFYGTELDPALENVVEAGTPLDVAVADGRAIIAFHDRLVEIARDARKSTLSFDTVSDLTIEGVLHFDARRIVLRVRFRGSAPSDGVLVLRSGDRSELARYPTPEPALSVVESGEHLVFGSRSTLSIATPACP